MMRFYLSLFIVCFCFAAHAEETVEQRVERKLDSKPREQFLTITEENDLFGSGSDRNYTNGLRLGWLDTSTRPPLVARWVGDLVPFFAVNDTTAVYYSLGQNLYTPRNILAPVPNPNDRPYAAFLYGSMGLATVEDNHFDSVEITAGMVGPSAVGEATQKAVHSAIGGNEPMGWDYQLRDEPGLMISSQRVWLEAVSADFAGLHFRTSPYVGATLGNVYTYANSGVIFQLMPEDARFQDLPPRVRPAMPGSGYFSSPDNQFSWSIFAGLEGRAMGRNIFLDGNSFRDSPSVDKNIFVGDANAGVALIYDRIRMTYTLNWRSEEFDGQQGGDVFGSIGLGYRF